MVDFTGQLSKAMRMARVALTPRGARIQTRLSDGLLVSGRNIEGYGGRGIYISRDKIEPEFNFLNRLVGEGEVFIDVGANTGIYTLKAAKAVGSSGVVLALEPFPEMLADLAYNVKINHFSNVRLRGMCAAGNTAADAFWANFGKPNSFSLMRRDQDAISFSVLKIKIDDLFLIEGLNRCDYIKIDAEGAEKEIIDGARRLIAAHRPIIQAEVTIADFDAELDEYVCFQAADSNGRRSPNRLFIPQESTKVGVVRELGLAEIKT